MTDSLREALEDLVKNRESDQGAVPADYQIAPHEVRELLAAHPVEPAPGVSADVRDRVHHFMRGWDQGEVISASVTAEGQATLRYSDLGVLLDATEVQP